MMDCELGFFVISSSKSIIYIGMQSADIDTALAKHDGGIDSNVNCSTQGIHFLFKF